MKPKKSTGPTSPAGKKKVSQNAVQLGAYAKTIVLPGESSQEFEDLCTQFEQDLNPQDMPGKVIVRQLAGIAWKLMRLDKVETQAINHLLRAHLKDEEVSATEFLWQKPVQAMLPLIDNLIVDDIPKIVGALKFAEEIKDVEITSQLYETIQKDYPYLQEVIHLRVPQAQLASTPEKINPNMTWANILGQEDASWSELLQGAVEELKHRLWFHMHRNEILNEYQVIKDARLLGFMERLAHGRVLTYLNREFGTLLSRYRIHEEWRKDQVTINMGSI